MKAQVVEEFKVSSEMRDLNVKFDQKAFINRFELCEDRMACKFFKLYLGFLYDRAPEDEVEPSTAMVDLLLPSLLLKSQGRLMLRRTLWSLPQRSEISFCCIFFLFFLLVLGHFELMKRNFSMFMPWYTCFL